MPGYVNKLMGDLAAQLRAGLVRLRRGYIDAAEALFKVVDAEREYPYEFLVFRLTGYRPARSELPREKIPGKALRKDLQTLVLDLCDSFKLYARDYRQRVFDIPALARHFDVSNKTIQRWRKNGLLSRRLVFSDGRRRIAFLQSTVEWFESGRKKQVKRSSKFSQLDKQEREKILRRARRMATFTQCTLAEVARRLAARTGRAVETVRYTIRNYDRENPDDAIFPHLTGPLDEKDREAIYRQFLLGASASAIARTYHRTRGSVYRIINEVRAKQLVSGEIQYVFNPEFESPTADKTILVSDVETEEHKKPPKLSSDTPAYLQALYRSPLLTADREHDLFRRYNYLKYKADKLRRKINPDRIRTGQLKKVEALLLQANAVKNQIIRANLRLVVSIAKRHLAGPQQLFELVSDGNVTLMKAVERFDFSRGNRFSTYATWAIMRNFARSVHKERHQLDQFATGHDDILDIAAGLRSYDPDEVNIPELRESIDNVLAQLSPRERTILIGHYGLDETRSPRTLEQLSHSLGLSKERVRQIEIQALKKLRDILNPQRSDLMT